MALQLLDLQPGDTIVYQRQYSEDWRTQVIESVTPTQIRADGWVYDRKTGRQRGADPLNTRWVFPVDHPGYVAYRVRVDAAATELAPLLKFASLSQLRTVAGMVNVKLRP